MEKLCDQYIFIHAFNCLAVLANTSFPDEVRHMLWRFFTRRQGFQVFCQPTFDKNTLTNTARKKLIHSTGNSPLVNNFYLLPFTANPRDINDMNGKLLGSQFQILLALIRLLHQWLSLVVVVYKIQQYPLSLVSVFSLMGNNQQLLNDHLELLSNLMLGLSKSLAEDSRFLLSC